MGTGKSSRQQGAHIEPTDNKSVVSYRNVPRAKRRASSWHRKVSNGPVKRMTGLTSEQIAAYMRGEPVGSRAAETDPSSEGRAGPRAALRGLGGGFSPLGHL